MRLRTANAEVDIDESPDGPIARIQRDGEVDFAGPLPRETLKALQEVANASR